MILKTEEVPKAEVNVFKEQHQSPTRISKFPRAKHNKPALYGQVPSREGSSARSRTLMLFCDERAKCTALAVKR